MKTDVLKNLSICIDAVRKDLSRVGGRLKELSNKLDQKIHPRRRLVQLLEFISILPGITLTICSFYTLWVPEQWFFAFVIFALSCGVVGTVLAVQAVLFKRRTYKVLHDIKGGIMIQTGGGVTEEQILNLIEFSGNKITLH